MIFTKKAGYVVFLVVCMTGCSSFIPIGVRSDSDVKTQLNDQQRIAAYFNRINPKENEVATTTKKIALVATSKKTTLDAVLEKDVPANFQVLPDIEIDPKTIIQFEEGGAWVNALSKSLFDVGIDMSISVHRQILTLTPIKTKLVDVIEKYVPEDYQVFSDAAVNLDSRIRYNGSLYWLDALATGAEKEKIEVSANVSKKTLHLKAAGREKMTNSVANSGLNIDIK
ncbi:hypothetical protein JAB4_059340 (plasmid) [Janthinobacterium sp. HH102]|uniref:hypothetical protein n=1 Tax=Janthinobacterium sp. HH102 TaxID=1537274 RepID=UPI00087464D4|nr:hypothetical protein [Janthinobacterium sp. HH102]QOU76434.1 hypothetical protein JAB4_059340 [Janthinobacterium sp. HH102]